MGLNLELVETGVKLFSRKEKQHRAILMKKLKKLKISKNEKFDVLEAVSGFPSWKSMSAASSGPRRSP